LPANVWLLVAFAALGSFVYGFAGFGSGLVGIPLALHFHDLRLVLGVFALLQKLWHSAVDLLQFPLGNRLAAG
jgi:uncharacterized membrane protein YfcA